MWVTAEGGAKYALSTYHFKLPRMPRTSCLPTSRPTVLAAEESTLFRGLFFLRAAFSFSLCFYSFSRSFSSFSRWASSSLRLASSSAAFWASCASAMSTS